MHTRKAGGDGCKKVDGVTSRALGRRCAKMQGKSAGRDSVAVVTPSRARVGLSRLRKLQGRTDGRVHGRRAGSCKPWQG